MYYRPKYPDSWVWLRSRRPVAGGNPADQGSYPVLACVRTVDQALHVAHRMGLVNPIYQIRMPYHRKLCKTLWWESHPARKTKRGRQ